MNPLVTKRGGAQEAREQFLALPFTGYRSRRMLSCTMELFPSLLNSKRDTFTTVCGFSCHDNKARVERNDDAAMMVTSVKKWQPTLAELRTQLWYFNTFTVCTGNLITCFEKGRIRARLRISESLAHYVGF